VALRKTIIQTILEMIFLQTILEQQRVIRRLLRRKPTFNSLPDQELSIDKVNFSLYKTAFYVLGRNVTFHMVHNFYGEETQSSKSHMKNLNFCKEMFVD
jgi:hypothetical protein